MEKIIIENYQKFFKKDIYKSLQKQRDIRKLPLYKIKEIQWKMLKRILEHAFNNTEFYRDYFESVNLTPEDIKEPKDMLKLPITEKKTYRKYFEKIISKDINENEYIVSYTSGSSGEPFVFYVDNIREGSNLSAAFILNKEAMGIDPFKKTNQIVLKTEPKNEIMNLKEGIKRSWIDYLKYIFLSRSIGIRVPDIKPENIDDIVRIIKDNKIEIIYGYSSSILSLAGYLSNYKEDLNFKHVITIGEGLLEQQREFISKIFNCPVHMDYGSSECMRMGFECKFQKGYHMDIYNYYFEYLKNGSYANNNERGEIIVTNLNNYVFPFIRYSVGDAGVLSNRLCECGINLPLLKKISGRITDIITTSNGKDLSGLFFAVLFEYLNKYVGQFQVVQVADDELLVKIIPTDKMNKGVIEDIEKQIYGYTGESMAVKVMLVEEIAVGESGKKRLMISKREYLRLKNNEEKDI